MFCRIKDLKNKFVVNVRNGSQLGAVADVEIDTASATVTALLIRGRPRLFGLLGHEPDTSVRWENIEVIGEDTILVNHDLAPRDDTGRHGGGFFRILSED